MTDRSSAIAAGKESVAIAEDSEITSGVDFAAADLHPTDRRALELLFGINGKHRGIGFIALRAPMQHRMRIEDLQATHQQDDEAARIDPMRDADEQGVPINQFTPGTRPVRRNQLWLGCLRRHRLLKNARFSGTIEHSFGG